MTGVAAAPTEKQIIRVVAVFFVVVAAIMALSVHEILRKPDGGMSQLLQSLAGLVTMVANTMWISMDRRRRGREVGPWRFMTIFCGPAALCLYLILEYKDRAIFFIPIVVALYLLAFFAVPVAAYAILKT